MRGKTVLITGATNGVGLEAAVAIARMGARVGVVGRDGSRTADAVAQVKARANASEVEPFLCDFSVQAQIRGLAADVRARFARLDVLINNAGTVFKRRIVTADGIEATFAVNHLGYFLLTNLLLDLLERSAPSRIVNVASIGHRRGTLDFSDLGFERGGYDIMRAYGRSKLGNILFTRELARRLAGRNIAVNCLHPGAVATNIWSGAPAWSKPLLAVAKSLFMISPEEGGQTLVYLATSPEVEGQSGLYFEKNRAVSPAPLALDDALAAQLWDESARRVRLAPEDLPPAAFSSTR